MSKTLAIIGASYLQLPLVTRAKELGLRVICFAWADGAVCAELADAFFPISIIEKEQILEICRNEKIDGICTIASDTAAPTVAYVSENLGLVGNRFSAALCANNKYQMRSIFSKNDIPCPRFLSVCSDDCISNLPLKFPLIVKPTDRSGSLGVTKVNDLYSLQNAVKESIDFSFEKRAIVEEYVKGREISVEFISFNGAHYPLTITDKVTSGAPHFVELEHHQPADLDPETYSKIYRITESALNALGIKNGASHSEYRITPSGDPIIIELGARMGGDFIGSDLVPLSTGYDYIKGVIDIALGHFEPPTKSISMHSGVFFLCKQTEKFLPYFEDGFNSSTIIRKKITEATLKEAHSSSDRSGYIIYQSDKKLCL